MSQTIMKLKKERELIDRKLEKEREEADQRLKKQELAFRVERTNIEMLVKAKSKEKYEKRRNELQRRCTAEIELMLN